VAKPRRPRGRARKPARPGVEPAVAPAATWIQVAPGKFVRANTQDQGLAAAPEPETLAGAAEAPTGVDGSPPEPLEDEISTTDSTLADAPAEANLIEPAPNSELLVSSTESATVANPQQDSPPNGLAQNASPAAGEYGIAPSASGSDLREALREETNGEEGWTGSSVSPRPAAETPDEAGFEPMPPVTGVLPCPGNAGVIPDVAAEGLPAAWAGSDGDRPTRGGAANPYGWARQKPGSHAHGVLGVSPRSRMSRCSRGGRSYPVCRSSVGQGAVATRRTRTLARRNFGRPRRTHHRFQPRSPPLRP